MKLTNEDLAVVPLSKRNWTTWNYVALWVSMSLCIPTYMMASSFIDGGMNWWQAILTIFLGNAIVVIPMILNGDAGARYGIPFPVFARSSFGILGANIPALLRAVVACGWFGIQTWIGGSALFQMIQVWFPGIANIPDIFPQWVGISTGQGLMFFIFWLLNMTVVYLGIERVRTLLVFKAFVLPAISVILVIWGIRVADGLGPILSMPSKFQDEGAFLRFFIPALTSVVGFWATVSLNIPDFTRFAVSQRAQILGQVIALPPSMAAFAFVGVIVTSASAIVFGSPVWDPIVLGGKFDSPFLVSFSMLAIALSTLATNVAANIVSPANDFSNLIPSKIDFKKGGYITGIVGIVIMPWKLVSDPSGYIFTWLIAYSSLLGPIGGIMIGDYFWIRKRKLLVDDLYRGPGSIYWFKNGFHRPAIVSFILGVLPSIPGFLTTTGVLPRDAIPAWLNDVYLYAWFVGFAVSCISYKLLFGRFR